MKKILTIILSGFGVQADESEKKTEYPLNFNQFWHEYPHTILTASGKAVGLETGTRNSRADNYQIIGSGRIRSVKLLETAEFTSNLATAPKFDKFITHLKTTQTDLHLIAVLSEATVSNDFPNLERIITYLKPRISNQVYYHLITTGYHSDPTFVLQALESFKAKIKALEFGQIATICGRYYALDYGQNWDRTRMYYDLITKGIGISNSEIKAAIQRSYDQKIPAEFLSPLIINNKGIIKTGSSVLWLPVRLDYSVQILTALTAPNFDLFARRNLNSVQTFTFYPMPAPVQTASFLERQPLNNSLGRYLAELGLTQARITETETYPEVTYYFDGEFDGKIEKCDHFLIPSLPIRSYDLKPQMSAVAITKKAINCMEKDYDFILVSLANPDIIGQTRNLQATLKAISVVDICLGKLLETAEENFYKVILLADQGWPDVVGGPFSTADTQVPFIIGDKQIKLKAKGNLVQVAPTILDYMDIALPPEMNEVDTLLESITRLD